MNNLIVNYHNVNVKIVLTKKDIEIANNIKKEIFNMSALNIAYNEKLLNQTIANANNFSKDKNLFLIFGTGGSNLGSKALINILQGKEKNRLITNSFSRGRVHLMRSNHDCIMTSSTTINKDNPRLTCRINGLLNKALLELFLIIS